MNGRLRRIAAGLLSALLLAAAPALAAEDRSFMAMDTVMSMRVPEASEALLDECERMIAELEQELSVTRADSEVARLNAGETVTVSGDTRELLRFGLQMGEETDGALDITLYPIVRAWGFTTGAYRVPEDAEIAELLTHVGYAGVHMDGDTVTLEPGTMVDMGSLAKGYASDLAYELLSSNGVTSALLSMGGNICCIGGKPDGSDWRVGIRDPYDETSYVAVLSVRDTDVITSGCYERYFDAEDGTRYGHIFDPSTGRPADSGLVSVSVIGREGKRCDALSTALYVMGIEKAKAYLATRDDVEAILIGSDDTLYVTNGLRDRFTPANRAMLWPVVWIPTGADA